jgi:hypothetical protein
MAAGLNRTLLAFGVLLAFGARAADGLDDPTRPAFDLVPGMETGQSGAAAPAPAPKGLQSVILSGRREAAIINGIEVEKGQKYGDAVLTVVNETCVVLMGPEGRQELHMFPGVGLSKTERACTGRSGLQTIRKTNVKRKSKKKSARAKRKPVVCADEVTKDGSGK